MRVKLCHVKPLPFYYIYLKQGEYKLRDLSIVNLKLFYKYLVDKINTTLISQISNPYKLFHII